MATTDNETLANRNWGGTIDTEAAAAAAEEAVIWLDAAMTQQARTTQRIAALDPNEVSPRALRLFILAQLRLDRLARRLKGSKSRPLSEFRL
jgi:hypothetical protein